MLRGLASRNTRAVRFAGSRLRMTRGARPFSTGGKGKEPTLMQCFMGAAVISGAVTLTMTLVMPRVKNDSGKSNETFTETIDRKAEEIKKDIEEKSSEMLKSIDGLKDDFEKEVVSPVKDKLANVGEELTELANEAKEEFNEQIVVPSKEVFEEIESSVTSEATEIKDKIEQKIEDVKEAVKEAEEDEVIEKVMEEKEEEVEAQGAYNPETGEINWDCPCLGGMANGPCGEEFKAAFSCFVYSEAEPKGIDCIEKFQAMQNCFRKYPEVYSEELMDEDESPVKPVESENAEKSTETAQEAK